MLSILRFLLLAAAIVAAIIATAAQVQADEIGRAHV